MSPPTIRDEVLAAWRSILLRANCRDSLVDALVLELEQACIGHGARLPQIVRPVDPNAVALGPKPAPASPDVAEAAAAAARAGLRPYGGIDTRTDRQPLTELPDLPEEPE